MSRAHIALLMCVSVACGSERTATTSGNNGSGSGASHINGDQQVLVLDAALEKAKRELAVLVAADPRDEKAIAEKRGAIEAVEQTLVKLRQRSTSSPRP